LSYRDYKTHDAERVREAHESGSRFSARAASEARAKIPELPSNLRWTSLSSPEKQDPQALPLFELIHTRFARAGGGHKPHPEERMHPHVLLE